MKVLICGAGRTADELLKRLGEKWEVTLIDKEEQKLRTFSNRFMSIIKVVHGDASSPVVLEEADIQDKDYVLALTNDDRSNLAIASVAHKTGIKNIMSLVYDTELLPSFTDPKVWTIPVTSVVGRRIYHYLQDPRLNVMPLAQGEAELMEVSVDATSTFVGKTQAESNEKNWRVVGLIRDGRFMFPAGDTIFKVGDRLLMLGQPDLFKAVCSIMECAQPNFPQMYGQTLVMAFPLIKNLDQGGILFEGLYLAQNTRTQRILLLCQEGSCDFQEEINRWSESLDISISQSKGKITAQIKDACTKENAGVVMIPPIKGSLLESLTKPAIISFAHSLPCPLLIAKSSNPYDTILVPFSGTPASETALGVALDLAQQFSASVTAVIIQEPDFLHGQAVDGDNWTQDLLNRIREVAHIHKIEVAEEIRKGNPVNEITELSKTFSLLVIGSTSLEKDLFSPNVGEHLVRKAPCSVLIITH